MAWGLLSLASMPSMLHEALVLLFRNRPLLACRDIPTLDRWIARAASATSAADILADD